MFRTQFHVHAPNKRGVLYCLDCAIAFSNSVSSHMVIPNCCALVNLLPASAPARPMSVLDDTLPDTVAPKFSSISRAASRVYLDSVPVNTTFLPDKIPSGVALDISGALIFIWGNKRSSVFALLVLAKKDTISFAIPTMQIHWTVCCIVGIGKERHNFVRHNIANTVNLNQFP